MARGKSKAVFLFALVALAACSKADSSRSVTAQLPLPVDEATEEEHQQIADTLSRIESLSAELGRPQTFRRVPIVLSNSNQYTDHPAACVKHGGEAQFIVLKRSVIERERALAEEGVEAELFRVILHEIGHCYFDREHEDSVLSEPGKQILLTPKRGKREKRLLLPLLDATVMVPENLTAPVALEKYYVAEILGVTRARELSDLAPYAEAKYVRDEPVP